MTDFLAGLVAKADGAPALARRRSSLFETPAQPPAAGDTGFRASRALGSGDPAGGWDSLVDETATVESPGPAVPATNHRRSSRSGNADPAGPPAWDPEPAWRPSGDDAVTGRERTDGSRPPTVRGNESAARPTAAPAPAPAPTPPARRSPEASQAPPVQTMLTARTIETIVERPAPGPPSAPSPLHAARAAADPEAPLVVGTSARGGDGTLEPARPTRPRPEQPDHTTGTVPAAVHAYAPVRPFRRPDPPAAGLRPGGRGARNLSAAAPPAALPAIHVTIARIEVRAAPARTPAPVQTPRPAGPKLGLDEYLRSRSGRDR